MKSKNPIINALSSVNCATIPIFDFCNCKTCSENEGDCDAHDECQDILACGSNNCPASLGFDTDVDCCHSHAGGEYTKFLILEIII